MPQREIHWVDEPTAMKAIQLLIQLMGQQSPGFASHQHLVVGLERLWYNLLDRPLLEFGGFPACEILGVGRTVCDNVLLLL